MLLGEVINFVLRQDQTKTLCIGLSNPHSYRGYYDCLALETSVCKHVAEMLSEIVSCVGRTFRGYKGGNYPMDKSTRLYIANYGDSGVEITEEFLNLLFSPGNFVDEE